MERPTLLARLATFLARCRLGFRARRFSRTVPLSVEGLEERTALSAATAAPGLAWPGRGPSKWSARHEGASSPRRPSSPLRIELPPADPFDLAGLPPTAAPVEPAPADFLPDTEPSQGVAQPGWTVTDPPHSTPQKDVWVGLGEWTDRLPDKSAPDEVPLSSTESPSRPETSSDGSAEPKADPVVSPTVSPTTGLAAAVQADGSVFRISRTPADGSSLRVHYDITAYAGRDAVSQGGEAVITPGSAHVDVSAEVSLARPAGPEILTLTLKDDGGYQVGRPTATLFRVPPGEGCSEAALFEAYRRGQSNEAFNALVERHGDAVFRTCSGILGNRADAEDVSQVVFMKLGRMQAPLQSTLTSWLSTVARNASIEFLRSRNRRMKYELRSAEVGVAIADESLYELREELHAALAQLPDALREAVRLRYLEGLSQQEAAEAMGCPRGTLSQRAARGIQCLRTILLGSGVAG